MPRRLVIPFVVVAGALALPTAAVEADTGVPSALTPVESPARFVPPPPPPPPSLAERAVLLARTQLGVPYSYGGASPAGFDCSGFIMWVYGRLGVTLPHNAAALFEVGRPVSHASVKPGDLLFFSGLGHVGMYIGRGRMIHAPQSGRYVEIQALTERSLPPIGARRVA